MAKSRNYMRRPSRDRVEKMGSDLEVMAAETKGLGPPDPEMLTDCMDGEVRPILVYPNPQLRRMTKEVMEFDERLRKLVADLAMTMYSSKGLGIAAPQIGEPYRVFLIDILNGQLPKQGRPASQLLIAVNPQIWTIPDRMRRDAERCLSFPDAVELIDRPTQVFLKAYNHRGKAYALGCSGDLSRAIQHEFDHLEGRLLVDYISKRVKAREQKQFNRMSSRAQP